MGAGVIPFAKYNGQIYFLFQTVFSGRKSGYLIDFGGGLGAGEDEKQAAIREFVEETETLYFADDPHSASRTPERIRRQVPLVEALFDKTLSSHPDWWCHRAPGEKLPPKEWITFFIQFPYMDIQVFNNEWASDQAGRFKKRRKLIWLAGDELLFLYQQAPERLWKRVRQLCHATQIIHEIMLSNRP